jgi:hypothetical protein
MARITVSAVLVYYLRCIRNARYILHCYGRLKDDVCCLHCLPESEVSAPDALISASSVAEPAGSSARNPGTWHNGHSQGDRVTSVKSLQSRSRQAHVQRKSRAKEETLGYSRGYILVGSVAVPGCSGAISTLYLERRPASVGPGSPSAGSLYGSFIVPVPVCARAGLRARA